MSPFLQARVRTIPEQFEELLERHWLTLDDEARQLSYTFEVAENGFKIQHEAKVASAKRHLAEFEATLPGEARKLGISDYKSLAELHEKLVSDGSEDAMLLRNDWDSARHEANNPDWWANPAGALQLIRQGFLLAVSAFLERQLSYLAGLARTRRNTKISLGDFIGAQGSDLARTRNYFEKVFDIAVPGSEWELMYAYREVRNRIAHDGGVFTDLSEKRRQKFLTLRPYGIDIASSGSSEIYFLRLEEKAAEMYLKGVTSFVGKLSLALSEWNNVRSVP